jgi:hypothetical protein
MNSLEYIIASALIVLVLGAGRVPTNQRQAT